MVGDHVIAEPLKGPPLEDPGDDWAARRVRNQARLGLAFGAAGRNGVRHPVRQVAVAGLADVPALLGMRAETVPGQLQHLQHVPLGDRLLDPPCEHRSGALARPSAPRACVVEGEGFVGSNKRDTALFQLVLDLGAEVGAPGDTLDRLGDDGHETAVGPGGLGEQILDPPVTRDRDIELLVCPAVTALI